MHDPLSVWYYEAPFDARRKQSSCSWGPGTCWNKATKDAFGLTRAIRSWATSTSTSSSDKPNSSLRCLGMASTQVPAKVRRICPLCGKKKARRQPGHTLRVLGCCPEVADGGWFPPVTKMWACFMSLCPRWTPMNLLPPTDSDTMVVTDLGETWHPRSRQVAGLPEGGLDAVIRRDRQGSSRAFAEDVHLDEGLRVEVRIPEAGQETPEELYKKRLVEVGLLEEIRRPSRP
jgi:hypothetical protein